MDKKIFLLFAMSLILATASSALVSALSIEDVNSPILSPGKEGEMRVYLENNLEDDVTDVSFNLDLRTVSALSIVGSSEFSIDEIEEGDDETLAFRIRASSTSEAGDYQIPYILSYKVNDNTRTRTGVIGVRIEGNVEIQTSISTENAIVGSQGSISIKLINKGFADARYVSIRLLENELILKSEELVYIGDIDANDFETASFDVIFQSEDPVIQAQLEYVDFSNNKQKKTILEQITVYTKEEAIQKGILAKNNAPIYIISVIIILALWLIIRAIRKKRRMRKSMQAG